MNLHLEDQQLDACRLLILLWPCSYTLTGAAASALSTEHSCDVLHRELAQQVAESCSSLRKLYNFKVACIFGGGNRASQAQELTGRPDIVVATPGRLLDLAEHASGALSELFHTSTECAACCIESIAV